MLLHTKSKKVKWFSDKTKQISSFTLQSSFHIKNLPSAVMAFCFTTWLPSRFISNSERIILLLQLFSVILKEREGTGLFSPLFECTHMWCKQRPRKCWHRIMFLYLYRCWNKYGHRPKPGPYLLFSLSQFNCTSVSKTRLGLQVPDRAYSKETLPGH